jgi:hypothetical protein
VPGRAATIHPVTNGKRVFEHALTRTVGEPHPPITAAELSARGLPDVVVERIEAGSARDRHAKRPPSAGAPANVG